MESKTNLETSLQHDFKQLRTDAIRGFAAGYCAGAIMAPIELLKVTF